MELDWNEWLNLALRWIHVFAGILWIGQTYYFTWLDGRLEADAGESGRNGQVWMVHSGGFYIVEKQKIPELLPRKLHWFKWEAAITWLTGVLLLGVVYYMGGLMTDPGNQALPDASALGLGAGLLVVAWFVYDALMLSPLGRSEVAAGALGYGLLVGLAFGLTRVLSGRAAYIHVGAVMGTLMAFNVWVRILPAQRSLIAATRAGGAPDMTLAARAKQRSKQNTFMVMPLVFIMLSNHYPVATYGHDHAWLVLSGLVLVGWVAAKIVREH